MQSWQEQWRAVAILAQVTRRSLGSDTGAGAMASSTPANRVESAMAAALASSLVASDALAAAAAVAAACRVADDASIKAWVAEEAAAKALGRGESAGPWWLPEGHGSSSRGGRHGLSLHGADGGSNPFTPPSV